MVHHVPGEKSKTVIFFQLKPKKSPFSIFHRGHDGLFSLLCSVYGPFYFKHVTISLQQPTFMDPVRWMDRWLGLKGPIYTFSGYDLQG